MQPEITSPEADNPTAPLCLDSNSLKQKEHSGLSNGNKNIRSISLNVYREHRTQDEIWALAALAAASLVQFIVMGIHNSFGVVYSQILIEFQWQRGTSAFIGSAAIGINFLVSPIGTQLCESFNPQIVTIVGGLISVIGLLGASFVSTDYAMFLSYSVLWGIGSSLCYSSTYVVVGKLFNRHMAVAMGIMTAGSGLGQLAMSPSIESMLGRYGWKITMRSLGAMASCLVLAAFTYREPTGQRDISSGRRNWRQLFDCSLWCIPAFLIFTISLAIFNFGYYVPIIHVVHYANKMGSPTQRASWLLSIMAIASVISRLVFGILADLPWVNRLLMFQVCLGMMALSTILCPFVATEYVGFALYMVIFGMGDGCMVGTAPTLIAQLVGKRRISPAIGLLFFSFAGPLTAGPYFAGWLYSQKNRYEEAFFTAGGTMVICVIMLSVIHCLSKEGSAECAADIPGANIDLVGQNNEMNISHHASERHVPNNTHFNFEGKPLSLLHVTSV